MPPTPSQIKEQLLKATDQDAKVTNMVSVLAAISCLENTQITKEALEETRLGKIVNDIRKNTLDSSLSTRCKKLVRIWSKQFVRGPAPAGTPSSTKQPSGTTQDDTTSRQPTPPTQGVTSNTPSGGKRTPMLKAHTSTTPTSTVDKKKSENHKRRKLGGSSLGTISSTGSTPSVPKKPRPAVTPTSNATKDNQGLDKKNGMPAEKDASNTNFQSSKSAFSKVKPSDSKLSSSRTSSPALKAKGASSPGLSKLNAKTSKVLSKSPLTKPVLSAVNSSSSKCSPSVIAASKASRSSSSVKAKQSTDSNCVDSSHVEADKSKKDNEATKSDLASIRLQNKSPKVHKNLSDSNSSSATVKLRSPSPCISQQQTSFTIASSPVEYDSIQTGSQSSELDPSIQGSSKTSFSMFDDDYDEEGDNHSDEKYSQMLSQIDKEQVLLSLAPSVESEQTSGGNLLDIASVEMTDENEGLDEKETVCEEQEGNRNEAQEEEQLPSKPVTEEDIQRIHQEEWDGVNGCYNNKREWFDWTQSLSIATQDDEALHILPYICLD